jgi:integrase
MSVFRHQGKWRYEFMIKGERYSKSGYETKQAARDAEAEARRDLKRMNMDFIRLCAARLKDLKINRSKKYLKENARLIKILIKRWKQQKTITKQDVVDYIQEVAEKRGANVANKELRFIKALFNHGINLEWFTYNPANGIKPISIKNKKRRYVPPEEDVQKVLDRASPRQKGYLLVVIHTLGRSSSVNNLRWCDIYDDYLILRTRKAKNSDEKEIKVPMNAVLKEALSKIPHNGEYVFMNSRTGKQYDYRDKLVPGLCKKAGVPRFTLHCLRHFGASKLDNAGVPLCDIQELLGHEQATTTSIYLRSLRGSTKDAVKKLEDLK